MMYSALNLYLLLYSDSEIDFKVFMAAAASMKKSCIDKAVVKSVWRELLPGL